MPNPPIRPRPRKPVLRLVDILRWADEFCAAHKRWPNHQDGLIPGTADQTWLAVDAALNRGHRGLPGGDTLAKLLHRHRGRWHQREPPRLSVEQVLEWADAHFKRTGGWPCGQDRTQIPGAPKGTTWVAVQVALARGGRGLPSGTTITQLLQEHRGVRNSKALPPLTEADILAWADEHVARTGKWPRVRSGPVVAAPGETWLGVDSALWKGLRGLPGGDTLARLLERGRGVPNRLDPPDLSEAAIRAWAEAYRLRTGRWPSAKSGPIPETNGETWAGVNAALTRGRRGMPGGVTLFELLNGRPAGR